MEDTKPYPSSFCIAVASHISNVNRIPYLLECLQSLVSQTIPVAIYLSISFATKEIKEDTLTELHKKASIILPEHLNIRVREQKTSQMRHYFLLYHEICKKHKWIMFCDDDDTYHVDRTSIFMSTIRDSLVQLETTSQNMTGKMQLAGLYENQLNIPHRTRRHEYWCYCIRMDLLTPFFEKAEPTAGILDDRCCDVLLAEYLRRKSPDWVYATITQPLYHYREEENDDSVTGFIQTNQHKYTNQTSPPPIGDDAWLDYVLKWNDYIGDNIHIFLHDTYLRTLVGCDLDAILRVEFQNNYAILDYVDQKHIGRITELHERVKGVCEEMYDLGL